MIYSGIVQKGGGFGRTLGFPTANIPIEDEALSGIYAAHVTIEDERYQAAIYADAKRKLLEAHLLDFEGDLYGREIFIELLEKLREDQVFAGEDEARRTIAADIVAARDYFNRE